MPRKPSPFPELRQRLAQLKERAAEYQAQGLPIPIDDLERAFNAAAQLGDAKRAEGLVSHGNALLARIGQDWGWLSELLQRVDGLRAIADSVGMDLARVDAQVGNPRLSLLKEPLSAKSLEKAAAGASFALAVLNDAIPKYIVQEAQALGVSIRRARDRGEDVGEAVAAFSRLLRSVQDPMLSISADHLADTRRAVARIPRAPAVAAISEEEEDEILSEARNLARRLHRIKARAHDATDAVRLISQVRQALSEDRRYASPEEEVEALWAEVDRLAGVKRLAGAGPALSNPAAPAADSSEAKPLTPPVVRETESRAPEPVAPARYDRVIVPVEAPADEPPPATVARPPPATVVRPPPATVVRPPPATVVRPPPAPIEPDTSKRPRMAMPIVPPMTPLMDEATGAPVEQSPDTLAEGAGPRVPRPTRIAIASAYVPPDLRDDSRPASGLLPPPGNPQRRQRSRHRE